MFGTFTPAVKNLLGINNEWRGVNTFTRPQSGASAYTQVKLVNPFEATASATQQTSPALEWESQGWKTNSVAASQKINFRQYIVPAPSGTAPIGNLKIDFSVAGAAYTNFIELFTTSGGGLGFPLAKISGAIEGSVNNSSAIGTLQNLLLTNPSGSKTNIGFKFASTIKAGFGVDAGGGIDYRGLLHNFFVGSTAESGIQVVQIYGNGIYNNYSAYNAGVVTAGSPDTGATIRLSTYGGFAGKGVLVTGPNYTLGDEMVVYADGSNANLCSGTATACNTYMSEGACNAHSGVGCSWFAGNSCSAFSGSDESTCESGHAGCTWEEQSCSGANNTDQSTCENQDDAYGGNCSWDTSTCPSQVDQASCELISGCTWNDTCSGYTDQGTCESNSCTWNFSDCLTDFLDETSCNAQTGCSWNGLTCDGQYNTSCVGGNCSGSLCSGNYATGNCNGVYGAACQGTANCNNLTDDGEVLCEAEAGCTWTTGASYTLPISSIANRGNTSRFYYVKNIGPSGSVVINAGAGDTLESAVSLAPTEAVLLHHFTRTANCSDIGSEGACNAQSPCSWIAACSSYGDESSCTSAGCNWDGSCTGPGASCGGGTYAVSKKWYKHASF